MSVYDIHPNVVFFFNSHIGGGGVQQGPVGTSAFYWPIVSAPGDYDDREFGEMKIGRGNKVGNKSHLPDTDLNSGRRFGKPATNRLSYGAALNVVFLWILAQ
jgi:hypothetical protein